MSRLFLLIGCLLAAILIADSVMHDPDVHPFVTGVIHRADQRVDSWHDRLGAKVGAAERQASCHKADDDWTGLRIELPRRDASVGDVVTGSNRDLTVLVLVHNVTPTGRIREFDLLGSLPLTGAVLTHGDEQTLFTFKRAELSIKNVQTDERSPIQEIQVCYVGEEPVTEASSIAIQTAGAATPTKAATTTIAPTRTRTPEATDTEQPTLTNTAEPTETLIPTETTEPTLTNTAEPTETLIPTETTEPTLTNTPEPTETLEPTETVEPTETRAPTLTSTPEPTETLVPTETVEPTLTSTAEPTETLVPTETVEPTLTSTAEPTATLVPTETVEPTLTSTAEPTATLVPTETVEPTLTSTAEPTATLVPTKTTDPTLTSTAEPTETLVPTETTEPTLTSTPEPTETLVPTETVEPTLTSTAEPTETLVPTETVEPTLTSTAEPTATLVPTETVEPTLTQASFSTATVTEDLNQTVTPLPTSTNLPPTATIVRSPGSTMESGSPVTQASPSLAASPVLVEPTPTPLFSTSDGASFDEWTVPTGWSADGALSTNGIDGGAEWVAPPVTVDSTNDYGVEFIFTLDDTDVCPRSFGVAIRGSADGYIAGGIEWNCEAAAQIWIGQERFASTPIELSKGEHMLRLQAVGSLITLFLDGSVVAEATIDEIQQGSIVAFWSTGVPITIESVAIVDLSDQAGSEKND